MPFKPKFILILLFLSGVSLQNKNELAAQNKPQQLITYNSRENVLTKDENEPHTLVAQLIKNAKNETERFDAIFAWVAANIRYDYKTYYSPSGSYKKNVRTILLHRNGVCFDYALLMDSLCYLAGLNNVSVFGYAKDDIFDVGDSLYVDNHVWNAVKLEGQWYLYDVTWSTGEVVYEYTRFSKWVSKLLTKIQPKYKGIKIRPDRHLRFSKECNGTSEEPAYYFRQRRLNYLLIELLNFFSVRVKQSYIYNLNTDFYLSDPAVFAITHFPDNPAWSLLKNSTMRKFETDSAYYHLNESTLKNQTLTGSECSFCDSSLQETEIARNKQLRLTSAASNPRNCFITSLCDYNTAAFYYKAALAQTDSSIKLNNLDTAISYYKNASTSLKQCKINIVTDFSLQKKKNNLKKELALNDNKSHNAFIQRKIKSTANESRHQRELCNLFLATAEKYRGKKKLFGNLPIRGI